MSRRWAAILILIALISALFSAHMHAAALPELIPYLKKGYNQRPDLENMICRLSFLGFEGAIGPLLARGLLRPAGGTPTRPLGWAIGHPSAYMVGRRGPSQACLCAK